MPRFKIICERITYSTVVVVAKDAKEARDKFGLREWESESDEEEYMFSPNGPPEELKGSSTNELVGSSVSGKLAKTDKEQSPEVD